MSHKSMSTHHRKCRSNGGGSNVGNLSLVPHYQHLAWHQLFGNKTAEQIAKIINEVWLDPAFKFVVVKK